MFCFLAVPYLRSATLWCSAPLVGSLSPPPLTQEPLVVHSLLIMEGSRSHSHTTRGRTLWKSDRPNAETSTWQHTTLTTDRYPCPRLDSNPQSPSKRTVTDPCFRARGHWDRLVSYKNYNYQTIQRSEDCKYFAVLTSSTYWQQVSRLSLFALDHTQTHTTVGRTPLDEWSARRRDFYLTTQTLYKTNIHAPPVGFEPAIPASVRPQTAQPLGSADLKHAE
jgi:hypothetical protein